MKFLIFVRHGSYGPDHQIDDVGKAQMATIGAKVKSLCEEESGSVALLSSTAPRALGSAKVLSAILEVPIQEHEVLWSDVAHETKNGAVLGLVQSADVYDIVVVVTHLEYCIEFPDYFTTKVLGRSVSTLMPGTYGATQVIDCLHGQDSWFNP